MRHHPIRSRDWSWLLAGTGLVVLAWSGSLDGLSRDYLDASLIDAGIIYGTARGINALVSVLQGTELDMWLVTFAIGELLDPINDLIERFSAVMTAAVTSLVIQQLLLVMVSHVSVAVALTLLGVATCGALLIGRDRSARAFARTFFLVALLRFSLSLVLVANMWVDRTFLPDSTSAEHAVMQDFYTDLDSVSETLRGEAGKRSEVASQFERLREKFDAFVEDTLALLGSMVLKSMIIPLVFLYAMVAVARLGFRTSPGPPPASPPSQ